MVLNSLLADAIDDLWPNSAYKDPFDCYPVVLVVQKDLFPSQDGLPFGQK